MSIELTADQLDALDSVSTPARVIDPRTKAEYVLVPVADFEHAQELFEEERRQAVIGRIAVRNAIKRIKAEP